MFAKIRDWFFTPNHVPAYGHVRVSGTQVIHRSFELPAYFHVEGRIISSSGKVTYLCAPTPKKVGALKWFEPDHIQIGNDLRHLVRSPSVCMLADPVLVRGEFYYPEGEERAYVKFTVYPE